MAGGELHILLFLISSIILTCSPHISFSSFSTRGNSFTPFLLLMGMFQSINRVQLFVIPWTIAHQTPLSMGFSRQECWSGLPYPPWGELLDPEIEPTSLMSPALAGWFFTTTVTWEVQLPPHWLVYQVLIFERKKGLCAHTDLNKLRCVTLSAGAEITDANLQDTVSLLWMTWESEIGCTRFYKVIGFWNWTMKLLYLWKGWQNNICKTFGFLGRQIWAKSKVGLIIDYLWEGEMGKQRDMLLFWHLLHSALYCNYFFYQVASSGRWGALSYELFTLYQSVHFSHSAVSNFATPRTAARQASLSITNSWSLLKLMCIKSVMASNHLILCRPLLLLPSIFPSVWVFSNESVLCIRWPKYWSSSFSICPSNEYSGLISFSINWFDLLAVQGTLKSLL